MHVACPTARLWDTGGGGGTASCWGFSHSGRAPRTQAAARRGAGSCCPGTVTSLAASTEPPVCVARPGERAMGLVGRVLRAPHLVESQRAVPVSRAPGETGHQVSGRPGVLRGSPPEGAACGRCSLEAGSVQPWAGAGGIPDRPGPGAGRSALEPSAPPGSLAGPPRWRRKWAQLRGPGTLAGKGGWGGVPRVSAKSQD